MVSVLFPFTFLSEFEARCLTACFNRCAVWLPSSRRVPQSVQRLADQGLISLEYPFGHDDARLVETLKHLESWAELHGPGHLRQLAGYTSTGREKGESSIYGILDEMTSYREMIEPGGQRIDPLSARVDWIHQNRLFLQIAQAFDQRGQELRNDMDVVDALEEHFNHVLHANSDKDETGFAKTSVAHGHIDRAYMSAERVRAWTSFLAAPVSSSAKSSGRILVTTSQAVEDLMIDAIPEIEPGLVLSHISIRDGNDEAAQLWRRDLEQWLLQWEENSDHPHAVPVPQPPTTLSSRLTVSLTVYRADLSPHEWLIKAADDGEAFLNYFDNIKAEPSTLLACVKNE